MKHGYALLLSSSLLLQSGLVLAQGGATTFNWKFEEGNKLMEEKLYSQAGEIWDQLSKEQPDNANLYYKAGLAYFSSFNQRQKALPYLEKASSLRNRNYGGFNTAGYDPFDVRERNAPIEVEYYLGRAYHLNSDFEKADLAYQRFMDEAPKDHELYRTAQRGKEQTANARVILQSPKSYQVSNVGRVINNDHPDFSPVMSVDGNALFFTSRRVRPDSSNKDLIDLVTGLPYENIYVSYKDREGNWQNPEPLNINPAEGGHLASVNVSADGQTLLLYRDDGGDGNLYESRLVGEWWSDPVLLGSDVNSKSWETHAAMTADGGTLYFVSDRKGGSGGRDIYRVVRLPNGEWSKAQNIGSTVNTPFDEDAVFIHPNGRTMYFASKGHSSMGGFDIFTTELQEDGSWLPPSNIGAPLNTVDDDIFFVTTADGRRGYFSSDQIGGYGEKDIYFVDLPEEMESEGLTVLKGFIVPPEGAGLPPSTVLYVTDKATGEVKTYKPRQRDGVYVVILPPCKEYNLDYRVDDKTIHTEDVFVECESAYQEINKEIYLNPVSITGKASKVDQPKGKPPGSKEKGEPMKPAAEDAPVAQKTKPAGKPVQEKPAPKVEVPVAAEVPVPPVDVPLTKVGGSDDVASKTDAQLKESGKAHTTPDGSYARIYARFYAYNMKDIDPNDGDWKAFVESVVGLINTNGRANIVIEASASKVPTKTFGTNEKLSRQRMEDARNRLIDAVRERGADPDLMFVEAINSLVQGPSYRRDHADTEKYGKFQYVKLKTR